MRSHLQTISYTRLVELSMDLRCFWKLRYGHFVILQLGAAVRIDAGIFDATVMLRVLEL